MLKKLLLFQVLSRSGVDLPESARGDFIESEDVTLHIRRYFDPALDSETPFVFKDFHPIPLVARFRILIRFQDKGIY